MPSGFLASISGSTWEIKTKTRGGEPQKEITDRNSVKTTRQELKDIKQRIEKGII